MAMITYPVWAGAVADLGAVITASAVTTTQVSGDIRQQNFRGIKIFLNVTAVGTSVTLTLQGKDPTSLVYYTILAGTAVVAPGFSVYTVYPTAPVTTNVSANDFIPNIINISCAVVGSSTFTVGAVLM